ncbi:hypothetical protein K437DRAFT_162155 [Tilletiaria anomala UBC 951]|uniref:Heme haloperoxidase family profile domain-containing protein n=1 Tax=Tilletiaria anomala (strain ATCC 24038 / CBS 436.72 / UBC 951) TaxID=1037660 RepID=A0A066WFF9_TILAU|nr:uncharacterized protein K437DRAFT_162155 [Tilletiaria anomala UBC 951]KDN52712.1 hypothetical protein K437DRAFT_162155 [Tilletiaria anomala UBC 951]
MKFTAITVGALAGAAAVSAESFCDKYSTALFNSTDGAQQLTLLTLVVNSALIGNYSNATSANAPVKPTGILTANGTFNGVNNINLLKYFDGSLLSTNRNGKAVSLNFLDGGGATPLKQNKAANDTKSNQHMLITHLYSYFGSLLGCSSVGKNGFPAYAGSTSQYDVHRFMNLNSAELGYFIQEVAYSAVSFGVSMEDIAPVGQALGTFFNNKCGAPLAVPSSASPAVQSVCLDPTCPVAGNSTCTASNSGTNGTDPAAAPGSSSSSGSGASGSGTTASSAGKVASGVAGALIAGAALAIATLI